MNTTTTTVRVLVSREPVKKGEFSWVAQCLDYDLAAQGASIEQCFQELNRTLVAHIACSELEKLVPFECLKPAPLYYWDEWKRSAVKIQVDIARIATEEPTIMRAPTVDARISA